MRVIDPGHDYRLSVYDGTGEVPLTFLKRMGEGYPGNQSAHPGTNLQEVLRALIARMEYLDGQIPDARNAGVIECLRSAIRLLEERAAERNGLNLSGPYEAIERVPTCSVCGHIVCNHVITHPYASHPTYTGSGCATCGQDISRHERK